MLDPWIDSWLKVLTEQTVWCHAVSIGYVCLCVWTHTVVWRNPAATPCSHHASV